jgi:hypothetical protein
MGMHGRPDISPDEIRGGHIMSYDLATGLIVDHSQWQPKGVFREHGMFHNINTIGERDLVITVNDRPCEIILYNPTTRATSHVEGWPKTTPEEAHLTGRQVLAFADGDILYQCGPANSSFGIYNVDTKINRATNLRMQSVLWNGAVMCRDRQKAYLTDVTHLYRFDSRDDSLSVVDALAPPASNLRHVVGQLAMSPDERKIYYVLDELETHPTDDLYEYDLETGTRTRILNLQGILGGPSKISGSDVTSSDGKIYFVFHSYHGGGRGLIEVDVSSRLDVARRADE